MTWKRTAPCAAALPRPAPSPWEMCRAPSPARRGRRLPAALYDSSVFLSRLALVAFVLVAERGDHAWVRQGGGISQGAPFRHVAEKAAHDLPAARLRELDREDNAVRPGDRADLLRHVGLQLVRQRIAGFDARLHGDERGRTALSSR